MIEATSNKALDGAVALSAWERLQAQGAARDGAAARSQNIYAVQRPNEVKARC